MRIPLCGENLVRLAFLDESGRSRHEPFIVVAGIVINGDKTYRQIEIALHKIKQTHIPTDDSEQIILHAKDIFQGAGYFRNKTIWPRHRRFRILRDVAMLPHTFALPVVFQFINKAEYAVEERAPTDVSPKIRAHLIDIAEHMTAFAGAEVAIEHQMRLFPSDEICMNNRRRYRSGEANRETGTRKPS